MSLPDRPAAHRLLAVLAVAATCGCRSTVEVLGSPPAPMDPDSGTPPSAVHADKVDLLFVVDNSGSMGDKQQVLALAVPALVARLTNPDCVQVSTGERMEAPAASSPCPQGFDREFPAVVDLHLGVLTTSLGGHGADTCSEASPGGYAPQMEDMARLITRGPGGVAVTTWQDKGFLNWDPGGNAAPVGEIDATRLSASFVELVLGAGEDGCGFEAPLEAWYRFLVDPEPYERMAPGPCFSGDTGNSCRVRSGIDDVVLQQRADFLRQDSLVAIVMLTDENDCSVTDGGQSFLALQAFDGTAPFHLVPGTAACATTPSSPDCKSCWEVTTSPPECAGWANAELQDPLNLRCYRQKQRFGMDFLYPISRYVAALTLPNLPGTPAGLNPLFCREPEPDGAACATALRDRSQIVLAGIVGVPWQDIARDPHDISKGLRPASAIPWDQVVGNLESDVEPSDPLMVESVIPRKGTNPATGTAMASSATPPGTPGANPINGFERVIPGANDLQYACIFDLPEPIDCTTVDGESSCDCRDDTPNPLCWDEVEQRFGTMQYRAKAYPGRRQLAVLQGVDSQAVVGSICATQLTDPAEASYGYRPLVDALVSRLGWNLTNR